MTERRRWSDDIKRRALELYVEFGPADAARLLASDGHHVPAKTIAYWARQAGIQSDGAQKTAAATAAAHARFELRRAGFADRMGNLIDGLLDTAEQSLAAGDLQSVKVAAVAAAVFVDKAQLLSGGATARTEAASEERVNALVDELTARRRKTA